MKKDYCQRCGEYKYINSHHIFPLQFFGKKSNDETLKLCLDCHAELHKQLPTSKQSKSFYRRFTKKFITGAFIALIVVYLFF